MGRNARKRVIGLMVTGAEADRYLRASLDEFKRLCDDAVIVLNHADKKTEQLIKDYGFWCYHDNREWGIHQPDIKTDLLRRIGRLNPDVVVPIDSDEVFDKTFTREELEKYSDMYPACYFYVVNLWNSEDRQKKSLGFWNIRMFNWLPELGTEYIRKNVHCGLGPPWTYNLGSYIPHFIKHYGLMKKEDRMRKVERYNKYDPKAIFKDKKYYETLSSDSTGAEFVEDQFIESVRDEVSKYGKQTKSMNSSKKKEYVVVRRLSDGQVLDIPKYQLFETLKRGFELVSDTVVEDTNVVEPPKVEGFQCPICGKEFKGEHGLKVHKKVHA